MRRTAALVTGVLLLAVVVVGAAQLARPSSAGARAEVEQPAVRPPLRPEVVAARDAAAAERTQRATAAAVEVEEARAAAQARWREGDVPLPPTAIVACLVVTAAILWRARADQPDRPGPD